MLPKTLTWTAVAAAMALCSPRLAALPQQPPQQPVFRASVELVRVDVQVVDRDDGEPVLGLGIDDFGAWLDGRSRRVVSAELVSFSRASMAGGAMASSGSALRTPGQIPEDARVYILAIDQMGLAPAAVLPMKAAIRQFLGQLRPQDMVAMYEFPYRAPGLDIKHDHSAVSRALDRVIGMRDLALGTFSLTPSEITDITGSDADTLRKVVERECDPLDVTCPQSIRMEANSLAGYLEAEAAQRMNGLTKLAQSLSYIPGRKTIVLMSGGLVSSTRTGGRPDVRNLMTSVGEDIANAQANLYVLHLDTAFMDAYSAAAKPSYRGGDRFESLAADRFTLGAGLEALVGKAGGALLSIEAGTPQYAFDRIARETTSYYLVTIEPSEEDRDGKAHFIKIKVTAKDATVRSRVQVTIPKK